MQRGWRRFRRLPAAGQVGIVLAVAGVYTALLLLVLGGGSGQTKVQTVVVNGKPRKLTPLEAKVRKLVTDAKLFQQEGTDIPGFRRPQVYSVRCKNGDCTVRYAVAVPGRGRIVFQQFEMVRAVFGHTDVSKLSILVTRSLPSGPNASPPAEEETARGLVLLQTACDKSKQPHNADWNSQKEAQAILERSCKIGVYNAHANQQATGNGPGQPGQ